MEKLLIQALKDNDKQKIRIYAMIIQVQREGKYHLG